MDGQRLAFHELLMEPKNVIKLNVSVFKLYHLHKAFHQWKFEQFGPQIPNFASHRKLIHRQKILNLLPSEFFVPLSWKEGLRFHVLLIFANLFIEIIFIKFSLYVKLNKSKKYFSYLVSWMQLQQEELLCSTWLVQLKKNAT